MNKIKIQEVFVLLGEILYEGSELLGVYNTLDEAKAATTIAEDYDNYTIQRRVIGANPQATYGYQNGLSNCIM